MTNMLEAVFNCDLNKLKALLNEKNVNYEIPGTEGCTPLHLVVGIENVSGKEAVLSYLLETGANPNARMPVQKIAIVLKNRQSAFPAYFYTVTFLRVKGNHNTSTSCLWSSLSSLWLQGDGLHFLNCL
ncbi:ankyrin repeat and LEM domain-containing protein 1 [Trichonephila clavipes]|nr:ankyrin repeat and LEM domain-containing protein 1 [Trichonephila clavipes]